jgi:hypothetical protein
MSQDCRCKAAFKRTFEPVNLRRLIIPVSISPCFQSSSKGGWYAGWKCDS